MKKTLLCLTFGLLLLQLAPVSSQTIPPGMVPPKSASEANPKLTRFNLDFHGGTPRELVAAITKALGQPLNAIISEEDNDQCELPGLKMNDVDVQQLFSALESASVRQVSRPDQTGRGYTLYGISYGFRVANYSLPVSDNTIWYFRMERPPRDSGADEKAKVVRYFSLESYLNRGFTVDDITTAIKTGWKIAGVEPAPELNYHKETKMLIAYDEPRKLSTIEQVLNTLPQRKITYDDFNNLTATVNRLKASMEDVQKKLADLTAKPAAATPEKSDK